MRICRSQAKQFAFAAAAELGEIAVCREHGVLNEVRRIQPPPKAAIKLRRRQDRQVIAVQVQQLPEGLGVAFPRLRQQPRHGGAPARFAPPESHPSSCSRSALASCTHDETPAPRRRKLGLNRSSVAGARFHGEKGQSIRQFMQGSVDIIHHIMAARHPQNVGPHCHPVEAAPLGKKFHVVSRSARTAQAAASNLTAELAGYCSQTGRKARCHGHACVAMNGFSRKNMPTTSVGMAPSA